MRIIKALVLVLAFPGAQVLAQDLESEAASPIWQVRYCVIGMFGTADDTARRLLEKLCFDTHYRVAHQAFAHYSGLFVDLDHKLVQAAFDRGDFNLNGIHVKGPDAFKKPDFWAAQLRETDPPDLKGRAIRALGMCGTHESLPLLRKYQNTDNSYVLIELAMAFRRLGDDMDYLATIESILRLPSETNVYYQNRAIDCLIQTHPTKARDQWNKLHAALASLPDLQPNWMYGHILQGKRLP